jgi:hypothetical protein
MRSVFAVWCVAAEQFWVVNPGQQAVVQQSLQYQPVAQQPIVWVPRADLPVVLQDRRAFGFLAARPRAPLSGVYMQGAPPPPPKRQGATVDQDGKSNVWAVEPQQQVEDQTDGKGLLKYAPIVLVIALIALAFPLLPTLFAANPDQG